MMHPRLAARIDGGVDTIPTKEAVDPRRNTWRNRSSLAETNPEIVADWDVEKNGKLINPRSGARIPLDWSFKQSRASIDVSGTLNGRPIAVEYDSRYFHSGDSRSKLDTSKTTALLSAGYLVVRVRENGLPNVPIDNPSLLQLPYTYRAGTDADLETHVASKVEQIVRWLELRTSGALASAA